MCQILRSLIRWTACVFLAAPVSAAAAARTAGPFRFPQSSGLIGSPGAAAPRAALRPSLLPLSHPSPALMSLPEAARPAAPLVAAAVALPSPRIEAARPPAKPVAAAREVGPRFAPAARAAAAAANGPLSGVLRDPSGRGHGRVLSAVFDAGEGRSEGSAAEGRFSIGPATEGDLDAIARIAHDAATAEQRKSKDGYRYTGFTKIATVEERRAHYARMMAHPHARFAAARDEAGRVVGFSLYFTKEFIDRGDPAHELYAAARDVAERYGPDEKLVFYSQAAVADGIGGAGLGKRMFRYVVAEALREGAGFLFGRIVNDRLLEGTVLEGQENRLDNVASRRAFTTVPGAVRVLERFVHAAELEAFLRDGRMPESGIHNWQLFGLALRPDRTVPADLPAPEKNFPPPK